MMMIIIGTYFFVIRVAVLDLGALCTSNIIRFKGGLSLLNISMVRLKKTMHEYSGMRSRNNDLRGSLQDF